MEENLMGIATELEKLKMMVPEGAKLRSVKCGNYYQYFIRKAGKGSSGEYIRKEDRKTAEMLAQIEYDEKLSAILQKNLAAMVEYKSSSVEDPFTATLNKMSPGKIILVKPRYVSDELFITHWKNQTYEKLAFREDYPEFYTRQGLRVRSKSEVIIADILDEMRIPFLYEKPLMLPSGTIHPDFTLLNVIEKKEIYWEHFGIMDDMDYRNNAFTKIRNYESGGFYQHDTLLWTFETGKYPLNTRDLRNMLKRMKKKLGYE